LWKYDASGKNPANDWKNEGFDDTAWKAGPAPLGFETDPLAEPLRTVVPILAAETPLPAAGLPLVR